MSLLEPSRSQIYIRPSDKDTDSRTELPRRLLSDDGVTLDDGATLNGSATVPVLRRRSTCLGDETGRDEERRVDIPTIPAPFEDSLDSNQSIIASIFGAMGYIRLDLNIG